MGYSFRKKISVELKKFITMIQFFGFFSSLLNRSQSLFRKKNIIVLGFIFPLILLGGLNIYKRIIWKEPSDGIVWMQQADKLTAMYVDPKSNASLAGIKKGDILYSLNGIQIRNKIDLAKIQWEAWSTNKKLTYEYNRQEKNYYPELYMETKGTPILYFYLVLIGMTSLVICLFVIISIQKKITFPYFFVFIISLTFYSFNIFSPTGHMDFLDSVFYWMDKTALLLFPPLLLHFFILFPRRKRIPKSRKVFFRLYYIPGATLFLLTIFIHLPNIFKFSDSFIHQYFRISEQMNMIHLGLFSLITFGILIRDALISRNHVIRKQLNLITTLFGLGFLPFVILYIIPFALGKVPSLIGELTVIFMGIIPLIFTYSISRYRLIGLEKILKKAVPFVTSYIFLSILYFVVSSQSKMLSKNTLNTIILGILAIILGATLFTPLKKLIQTIIDRITYRRSYEYRKTLLSISQEVGKERNLQKLSKNLLVLTANALSLKYIALLLPSEESEGTFLVFKSRGTPPATTAKITFEKHLVDLLKKEDFLSYYSLSDKGEYQKISRTLSQYGFFHFLPLKTEDKIVGCLGMGKKTDNSFLSPEDIELLITISSSMALALENAYLFDQANIKAQELERLKDYSENIIESLTVGVVVLDLKGTIIGCNRVLESTFSLKKKTVINRKLENVLGKKNFSVIFPSDTQKDYRLMSEISIEMPDQTRRIFDITKTPLLDNKQTPYGTIIVFEDITEKISLQQQLLTSEKLASIGLLSAGVAHEINTPLTGISSYVQILQKKVSSTQYLQILDKIEAQTERVGKIVKNLLSFSRSPSESRFQMTHLEKNLTEIVALIEYKLKNMNIELDLHLNSVPPIYAQGEKLQQVFINIILNAIDAMPSGGTLQIELLDDKDRILIKIKDTGTGIQEQQLPHIFDPFFTTKGIGKGTGLGLSISYAIIQEHKGQIQVKSEPGKGSLFIISIPTNLDKPEFHNKSDKMSNK